MSNFSVCPLNRGKSNLNKANLSGALLNEANINRANLSEAELFTANLSEANLNRANFDGANLGAAVLRNTIGLTFNQLSKARSLFSIIGMEPELLEQIQKKYPHLLEEPEIEDIFKWMKSDI